MDFIPETKKTLRMHVCDTCEVYFECEESWLGPNGLRWCNCFQLIVHDEGAPIARLAFWCSDECHDADYPQEDEELPDLEGDDDPDGEETEEEPMPILVDSEKKA